MKPELQQALTEIMAVLSDAAKWSAAMAQQELPLLVQEYLRWGLTEGLLMSLLLLPVCVWLYHIPKALRALDRYAWPLIFFIGGGIGAFMCGVGGFVGVVQALKITVAPRVYLLEQLTRMVQ